MSWFYAGYFCGWYVLLGFGYISWLAADSSRRESWGMIVFGAVAYFLLIPSLLFGLMPALERISTRSKTTLAEGLARKAFSRGEAFAVGLLGSIIAMTTSAIAWGVAAMSPDFFSVERLGDNGLALVMVALAIGTLAIISACPWFVLQFLLIKCGKPERATRPVWPRILPITLLLAWAVAASWLAYRLLNATTVMTARLEFETLPASDEPLREALRSQPGMIAIVTRRDETIIVECTMSAHRPQSFSSWGDVVLLEYKTLGGQPHTLKLNEKTAECGYGKLKKAEFGGPKIDW